MEAAALHGLTLCVQQLRGGGSEQCLLKHQCIGLEALVIPVNSRMLLEVLPVACQFETLYGAVLIKALPAPCTMQNFPRKTSFSGSAAAKESSHSCRGQQAFLRELSVNVGRGVKSG